MQKRIFFVLGGVLILGIFVTNTAFGAGFSIFEQGTKAMGRSGAFTATADDPSAIFFNPAGLAFQPGFHIYLGATSILPNVDFTGANPFPGEGVSESVRGRIFLPPHLYITYGLTERITLGIGIFSAFGLATEWENPQQFTGRYISTLADLKSMSFNPALGFRISDRFAIGVGLELRGTKVTLERYAPFFNPFTFQTIDAAFVTLESDWAWNVGFNAGLLYKVTDHVQLGFSYRHSMDATLKGNALFDRIPTGNPEIDGLLQMVLPAQPVPAEAQIPYPKILSGGIAVFPWEGWEIEVNVNWMEWSRYKELTVDFPEDAGPAIEDLHLIENYDDVFSIRLGIEKQINERFSVRGGFIYDQSPAPIEAVDPVLPDADRFGVNAGVTFHIGSIRVDIAELLLFFKSRNTEGTQNYRGYYGTYKNFTNLFAISLGYEF